MTFINLLHCIGYLLAYVLIGALLFGLSLRWDLCDSDDDWLFAIIWPVMVLVLSIVYLVIGVQKIINKISKGKYNK